MLHAETDLCIFQVRHCQRRSWACRCCLTEPPSSSLLGDSLAAGSLTGRRRMLAVKRRTFTSKHKQRCRGYTLFQSETRLFSLPKQKTFPETDAMNWVKSRSVSGRSTRETSRDWGCRARPAFTSDSGRDTWTRRDREITWLNSICAEKTPTYLLRSTS